MEINDSQKSELEELLSINRYMGYDQYMLVFKFVMKVKGFQIIQENQNFIRCELQNHDFKLKLKFSGDFFVVSMSLGKYLSTIQVNKHDYFSKNKKSIIRLPLLVHDFVSQIDDSICKLTRTDTPASTTSGQITAKTSSGQTAAKTGSGQTTAKTDSGQTTDPFSCDDSIFSPDATDPYDTRHSLNTPIFFNEN